MYKLAIVIPCYNEEEVIDETAKRLNRLMDELVLENNISKNSYILFVDDGSSDLTWEKIESLYKENAYIKGLKLAGNVGHQNALMAGLMVAKNDADIIISIDADLQDDINVIPDMIGKYKEGFDIVYGVRNSRKTDSFFKRNTALLFYKLMHICGAKTVYNHADYRLISRRAAEYLGEYKETNLFLRGIIPLIGYKTTTVVYDRAERFAGESKYPLSKMLKFALDGITSFSTKPITMVACMGLFFILLSFIAIIYIILGYFNGNLVPGWSSIVVSVWFLGGVQLLSIGIIGQYVGKTYMETKHRPRYNIEKELGKDAFENEED